jgi:hypothetical protein
MRPELKLRISAITTISTRLALIRRMAQPQTFLPESTTIVVPATLDVAPWSFLAIPGSR